MLVERSDFTIRAGSEEGFQDAMATRGVPLLQGVPGVLSVQCGRGVERPDAFMLLVAWESMDAHKAYNLMPECQELRALIGGFATGGSMEHFEMPG
ncbi:antibiotic biosynthesis monooxygenase [Sphingobium sufflavum]|uniref:antibiotic biosynthesis monooxygenase family protein n=1 Tax=Sphingobium sufflavum TaxID=1129547 RepID=UPI001F46C769|nr:antibiotic biosynthesis monooxygenase family protein [Sphingobium sufflavum]MCE7798464.1 antibiotic biosynthesis monooxygenase [Sphingobium sufflavum]